MQTTDEIIRLIEILGGDINSFRNLFIGISAVNIFLLLLLLGGVATIVVLMLLRKSENKILVGFIREQKQTNKNLADTMQEIKNLLIHINSDVSHIQKDLKDHQKSDGDTLIKISASLAALNEERKRRPVV